MPAALGTPLRIRGAVPTNISAAAGPGVSGNGLDVALASPGPKNCSERPPTSPDTARSRNRATPCTVATLVVPSKMPSPTKATFTVTLVAVTRLSALSRTSTTGCVVRRTPEAAPVGAVVRTTFAGAPGVTVRL